MMYMLLGIIVVQGHGVMWHYDGTKWTNIKLLTPEGGQISGAIDLSQSTDSVLRIFTQWVQG